jgi:hypothetical protein
MLKHVRVMMILSIFQERVVIDCIMMITLWIICKFTWTSHGKIQSDRSHFNRQEKALKYT